MWPLSLCRYVLVTLVIALPVSCSDQSGPQSNPSRPQGAASIQILAFAGGLSKRTTSAGADIQSIEVDRVLLVLGRVKLEAVGNGTIDFVDERSIIVELVPGDEPVLAIVADVAPGSYKELEIAFDKLERGHPTEQALIQLYPGLDNASVLIEGTLTRNGTEEPFAFAKDLDIDLEVQFVPPLTIESPEPTLFSLVLDARGWFRGPTGALLDPTDPSNQSAIEGAIQQSIELFEDPDHNGLH